MTLEPREVYVFFLHCICDSKIFGSLSADFGSLQNTASTKLLGHVQREFLKSRKKFLDILHFVCILNHFENFDTCLKLS